MPEVQTPRVRQRKTKTMIQKGLQPNNEVVVTNMFFFYYYLRVAYILVTQKKKWAAPYSRPNFTKK